MTATIVAADVLVYALARIRETQGWALDAIGDCDCGGGHEHEVQALLDEQDELRTLAMQTLRDTTRYSNGRRVRSSKEITPGFVLVHVWHPDAHAVQPFHYRDSLPSDPGQPSPGLYEVQVEPVAQAITVRVLRPFMHGAAEQ